MLNETLPTLPRQPKGHRWHQRIFLTTTHCSGMTRDLPRSLHLQFVSRFAELGYYHQGSVFQTLPSYPRQRESPCWVLGNFLSAAKHSDTTMLMLLAMCSVADKFVGSHTNISSLVFRPFPPSQGHTSSLDGIGDFFGSQPNLPQ